MKLKQIAAILACGALTLFNIVPVYAEETEDSSSEESASITSEDGQYVYQTATDSEGEKYAILETYQGSDTEIVIPSEVDGIKVTELGDNTFYMNTKAKTVTIPASITDFGYYTFYGCTGITEFKVDENNEIYESIDGAIFGENKRTLMYYPAGKGTVSYKVPDTVEAIGSSAFAMSSKLESIEFPEGLTFLGKFAFSECESLKSIKLPDDLTEIGQFAFSSCTALSEVTLPVNLVTIYDGAFSRCSSLKEIDWPLTLTTISQAAFAATGFDGIFIPPTVTTIGYSAFGFNVDQSNEFVVIDGFKINGYNGSYAATYAKENSIEFVAIDETEASGDDSASGSESSESKDNRNKIIVVSVVGGVIIICAAVVVISKIRGRSEDNSEEDSDADENNGEE